jgi:DNA-binding NtrC family response regulator
LITFIENKSYRRVGSSDSIQADVRFVFATNKPLSKLLDDGILRDDFAFRLERMQLKLLPLQNRPHDLIAATAFSLAKIHLLRPRAEATWGFSPRAISILSALPWPGNLRQLENVVAHLCERASVKKQRIIDEQIVSNALPDSLAGQPRTGSEILAAAAGTLARELLSSNTERLSDAAALYTKIAREVALTARGGDPIAAAAAIDDDRTMLKFAAENSKIQR